MFEFQKKAGKFECFESFQYSEKKNAKKQEMK